MATSFRKATRGVKAPDIIGTRISVENAQLLISTGAPDFDSVIGGGLAVGTLLLIEEDPSGSYARLLAKLFLAEGVVVGHPLFIASRDMDPAQLVREVPSVVSTIDPVPNLTETSEDLKIAWRYQHLPTANQELRPSAIQFGHYFDLSKAISPEAIQASKVTCWSEQNAQPSNISPGYELSGEQASLLSAVRDCITEHGCWVTPPPGTSSQAPPVRRTVLRLVLHALGSPCWGPDQAERLSAFLFALRALVRAACAVCLVTVPANFLSAGAMSRCERLSDYCVELSPAISTDGKKPALLASLDGVFKIKHLAAINCFTPHRPPTFDLGFKVRRKKFVIEALQLPPELTESTEREQDDVTATPAKTVGCASSPAGKRLLDF